MGIAPVAAARQAAPSQNLWTLTESDGRRTIQWPDWSKIRFGRKQAEFFFSTNPREIAMAGRGFGKDHIALMKKVYYGLMRYFERREGRDPNFNRLGLKWHLGIFAGESQNYADNIIKLNQILPTIPGIGTGGQENFVWRVKEQRFELFGKDQFWISMHSLFGNSGGQRGPGYDDVLLTEPQEVSEEKVMSVIIPMTVRPGFECRITLVGTGNCGWFDAAYEQARGGNNADYWGNFAAFDGSTFDNPITTEEVAKQVLREYRKNQGRFQRERLGMPNVRVTADTIPDCPFHQGMVEACLTKKRIGLEGPPLIVIDLAYGGTDSVCVGVWNKTRAALFSIDFFTAKELELNTENPYDPLKKLFIALAARYPGCTICYDAQGQFGGALSQHIPKHIRIIPMRRDRNQKNAMVEDALLRMGTIDAQGKSTGLILPDPNAEWLDPRMRTNMVRLLEEFTGYRKVIAVNKKGDVSHYYTKGERTGDDGVDVVTWTTSQLHPMNTRLVTVDPRAINRAMHLG